MSDLRDIAVKYAHLLSAPDYSKLLNLADEIERLRKDRLCRCADEVRCEMKAEIERLEDDVENLRNTITSMHLTTKEQDSYLEEEREKNEKQVRMTMDAHAEIERLRAVVDAADDYIAQVTHHHTGEG